MIAERIKALLLQKGWKPAELARRALVPQPTIHRILKGESRNPRRENIEAIAHVLGCPAEFLWSGNKDDSESESIADKEFEAKGGLMGPVYELEDSACLDGVKSSSASQGITGREGPCSILLAHDGVRPRLKFGRSTLRHHGVEATKAVAVEVRGNSMDPLLPDGSIVAVNAAEKSVIDGKIYALTHDGLLRVKTLYRLPGGGLRLRSFNREEHSDEEYTASELKDQELDILGRVFWSAAFR
ncbi:XRE family transcriptional regulator [Pseudomonas turukhanskensis]|uniref:XRE family transcriptional regulator n=1 Tax=Pseudomonas turukhanskensis TaxID=1806536 RepID=UPI0022F2BFDC|nr:XRE family transcriptional regulator [Pseudomonas turukhanskensis]